MRKVLIGILFLFNLKANSQELYVGANYHPHDDKNMEKIKSDIQLMKEAGFKVVRMGHLAWDSYEPSEGKFDFGWFDKVMDRMNETGIKVILDIAIRPASIWLHHKYPSIDIVDVNGARLYPNHRYMEDVGDAISSIKHGHPNDGQEGSVNLKKLDFRLPLILPMSLKKCLISGVLFLMTSISCFGSLIKGSRCL